MNTTLGLLAWASAVLPAPAKAQAESSNPAEPPLRLIARLRPDLADVGVKVSSSLPADRAATPGGVELAKARSNSRHEREDLLPVLLYTDDVPSLLHRLVVHRVADRGQREDLLQQGGLGISLQLIGARQSFRNREIAFCKTDVGLLWRASIAPTLVDLNGSATVASTPWGVDPANWSGGMRFR